MLPEVILGGMFAMGIVCCFYVSNNSRFLFFSEPPSEVVCSRPKQQQFKCVVYRNGEMIGSTNSSQGNLDVPHN
jgi:hypothetical protein